jgi:pimeloyl-ACP methyl ester carboxylesterase
VAGLIDTLRTARRLYTPDGDDLNLLGFSQGATVALEIARRLDLRQDGAVRRVFVAAGSVATPLDAGLAFDGTMLVLYEPGRNGLQNIANFMTGEPSERAFLPWILQAKGCVPASRRVAGGVEETIYRCRDGRTLVHLFERTGEHAWPGQAAKYDSWLMGRGSRSHVDLTAVIAAEIETGRMPPLTQ